MNEEEKLINKYGKDSGMKVPEGYFEAVYAEINAKLPEYKAIPVVGDMSLWQRVKPYVYLAAMFAGIWLMMKVFHDTTRVGDMSLENPPAQVALAMADNNIHDEFVTPDYSPDFELEDKVIGDYTDIKDFERDFGYSIDSRYDNLKLD